MPRQTLYLLMAGSSVLFWSGNAIIGRAAPSSILAAARIGTAAAGETLITILHTNDQHSQIDPLPANDRNAGKGGVARRATLVKRIRAENPNTLLLDAGDSFQGTPYFNLYRGVVEYKAMTAIGYDIVTLGNHDFDNGVEALAEAMKHAKFELVSANYDVRGRKTWDALTPAERVDSMTVCVSRAVGERLVLDL